MIGMISTPIILFYLGEEKFGTLRVLLDWLAHLSLMEFGLYAAVMAFMAKAFGEKKGGLGPALRMSIHKYKKVLIAQICAIFIFSIFFDKLVPIGEGQQKEAWMTFLILGTSVFFIFSQIFKAELEASQRGYIVSYVMMGQNVIYVGASILFLYWGWSLKGQAVAYVLSIAVAFGVFLWLCRGSLKFLRQKQDKSLDHAVFTKQRINLFITELCGRASLMSDNLMITFVLGAKEVTAFFITQRLIQVLQSQLQNVSGAAWPALGELYYENEHGKFKERVLQLTEFVAFLSGVSLTVTVIFNSPFILLWTGENTFAGVWISNLAAINAGFFALMSLWSWCFSLAHKTDRITKIFIGQAIVNVSLSYILTSRMGVVGPLLAAFIGYVGLAMWWVSFEVSQSFSISFVTLLRAWFLPFIVPLSIAISCITFFGEPKVTSWWSLTFLAAGLTIIVFLINFYLLLTSRTREFFLNKIKKSKVFKKT